MNMAASLLKQAYVSLLFMSFEHFFWTRRMLMSTEPWLQKNANQQVISKISWLQEKNSAILLKILHFLIL